MEVIHLAVMDVADLMAEEEDHMEGGEDRVSMETAVVEYLWVKWLRALGQV